jgi:hypothetical protein
MGPYMMLYGEKHYLWDWEKPENNKMMDEFPLDSQRLLLGQWGKHPNLHGYVVQHFADGRDEGQDVELSLADLEQMLGAVVRDDLPTTTGLFFGENLPEDREPTIEILKGAIAWLTSKQSTDTQKYLKSVVYRASW